MYQGHIGKFQYTRLLVNDNEQMFNSWMDKCNKLACYADLSLCNRTNDKYI